MCYGSKESLAFNSKCSCNGIQSANGHYEAKIHLTRDFYIDFRLMVVSFVVYGLLVNSSIVTDDDGVDDKFFRMNSD